MEKKKILFVIGQLGIGGGERQLYFLLKGLSKTQYHPEVISMNPGKEDYWEKPISDLGIKIHFVPRNKLIIFRIFNLFRLIYFIRPDILISWTLHLNFFVSYIGKLCGVSKTIGSIRNDLFNPMKKDRSLHRFFGTKGSDIFIANSTKGKQDMVEKLGINSQRIIVIFNTILLPSEKEVINRTSYRKSLGFTEDDFVLVNIGRLESSKNQLLLLKALVLLTKLKPNIHLVLIGKGPLLNYYQKFCKENDIEDRVRFLGQVPNAINCLPSFDLMCHTGLAEGMPNVLLEAHACKLPIVTTRVNGAEDIVIHGTTGYIVEYNDVDAIVKFIKDLYEDKDKRIRFGRIGNERVRSNLFSDDKMVNDFIKIFAS